MSRYIESEINLKTGENNMSGINPINVNTQGIGAANGFGAKPKSKEEEAEKAEVGAKPEGKAQVSADKVLDYMAQSAVTVKPKTIDPSKYVDSKSEARIAAFMGQFEDIVATNLSAINAEHPQMSEGSKMALALAQYDKQSA